MKTTTEQNTLAYKSRAYAVQQIAKKPNKDKAYQTLNSLCRQLDELGINPESLQHELGSLYKFFQTNTNSTKPKTSIEWIAKAVSKESHKGGMQYVYVDSANIVATDGRRLHMDMNIDKLPTGYYNSKGDKIGEVDDIGHYPNYDMVIPNVSSNNGYSMYNISELNRQDMAGANRADSTPYTILDVPHKDDELHVNTKFLNDILSLQHLKHVHTELTVYIKDASSPIMFTTGIYTAVMMPLRK